MNLMERLASPQLEPLLLVLVNFLWQGCLIALVWKIGLFVIGQGRPHSRYAWSLFAFAAMVIVPAITLIVELSRPSNEVPSARIANRTDLNSLSDFGDSSIERESLKADSSKDQDHDLGSPEDQSDIPSTQDLAGELQHRGETSPPYEPHSIPSVTSRESAASAVIQSAIPSELNSALGKNVPLEDVGDDQGSERLEEPRADRWSAEFNSPGPLRQSASGDAFILRGTRKITQWFVGSAREHQAILLLIWWLGLIAFSFKLSVGSFLCMRLRREHGPLQAWSQAVVNRLAEQLGLRLRARLVRTSRHVSEAIAVGLLRPMVLMPIAWIEQLPPETVQAILAHELAHLRRYDLAVNFLQRVIETCFFFHPAVWWISNQIRFERECCCDQLAVQATGNRVAYAKALAEVARLRIACQSPGLVASFLGGKRMNLLKRVHCLLDKAPRRRPLRLSSMTALFVLTSVASLSAMTVMGRQDDGPQRDDRDRVEQRDRRQERGEIDRGRTQDEREARRERRRRARIARDEERSDVDEPRRDRIDRDRPTNVDAPRYRAPESPASFPRLPQSASSDQARDPRQFPAHLPGEPSPQAPRDMPPEAAYGADIPPTPGQLPPHAPRQRRGFPEHGRSDREAPRSAGVDPFGNQGGSPFPSPGRTDQAPRDVPFSNEPRFRGGSPDQGDGPFAAPSPWDERANRFAPAGQPSPRDSEASRFRQGDSANEELMQMLREMRDEIRQLRREVETLRQQVEPVPAPRLRRQGSPPTEALQPSVPTPSRAPANMQDQVPGRVPSVRAPRSSEPTRSPDEFFPRNESQPSDQRVPANPAPAARPARPSRASDPIDSALQPSIELPSAPLAPAINEALQGEPLPELNSQPLLDDALPPVVANEDAIESVAPANTTFLKPVTESPNSSTDKKEQDR